MKTFAVALILASASAIQLRWPSVARCTSDHISTDGNPCDHNNNMEHNHDGTTFLETASEIVESWPSVARCNPDQTSKDSNQCDHNNNMPHPHDGTALQLTAEFRPPIKCIDPVNGFPITCDTDDINSENSAPLPKDENGLTPTKIIVGGPLTDNNPVEADKQISDSKKAQQTAK